MKSQIENNSNNNNNDNNNNNNNDDDDDDDDDDGITNTNIFPKKSFSWGDKNYFMQKKFWGGSSKLED